MRVRNAARRCSKAGLRSAGPPPTVSLNSLEPGQTRTNQRTKNEKRRLKALEWACKAGRTPRCETCGLPMVKRRNAATRQFFYGCSAYPTCRNTRPSNPCDAGS